MSESSDVELQRPINAQASIYESIALKQDLVAKFGVESGFRSYCAMLQMPATARLAAKQVAGLRDYAAAHALLFVQTQPSGVPFECAPPRIVGPSDARPLRAVTRSFFVACFADAQIRGRSAIIEVGDKVLLDAETHELTSVNENLELDPAIFHYDGTAHTIEGANDSIDIDEAFVSLVGPHSDAFGHWIWEYLPKYLTAVASGALPKVPILIDAFMPPQHRQALYFLTDGSGVEVTVLPTDTIVRLRRLWCAPMLMYLPLIGFPKDTSNLDLAVMPAERFVPTLHAMGNAASRSAPTGLDRIFLARSGNLRRKLVNKLSIEDEARGRGFAIVYPQELSFAEQVRTVRHAKYIVGPEGSAMYLSFFAATGTKLCILNHPFVEQLSTYAELIQAAGVNVTALSGPAIQLNNEPGFPNFGLPHFADYRIDEADFKRFLDEWLNNSET